MLNQIMLLVENPNQRRKLMEHFDSQGASVIVADTPHDLRDKLRGINKGSGDTNFYHCAVVIDGYADYLLRVLG